MAKQAQPSTATKQVLWTSLQAYTMAVLCLIIGIGAGYFLGGSRSPVETRSSSAAPTGSGSGVMGNPMGDQKPSPEQMKRMADTQAKSLLEELKSRPNDTTLLTNLGNIYFDTGQYKDAIEYYSRVLKIQPTNTNVRTDLGIAYWEGMRDADRAISEFNTALSYEPTKPQTLQSLGIVKWQGKADNKGAIAAWQKLLQTNPNYDKKADIQQLIAQVQAQ